MKVTPTKLPEVLLIEPQIFQDARGAFMESWNARRYAEVGIEADFVQENISRSSRGVLRGIHLQHPKAQGKLMHVLHGEVFDVAIDLRRGSPNFGDWVGVTLSAENGHQLWVPPGFYHGFCVTSETAVFVYKCTDFYAPDAEIGLIWNDPRIAVSWPMENPILSEKDSKLPTLAELPEERLPRVGDYSAV